MKTFKNERELQEDLAEFLRCSGLLTFTEIQIPGMHSARADVIAMTPHRYSTKDVRLYEVKLTRSAWMADKKYHQYLECCNRMYIACPNGVIKKNEVPEGIGLITRNENSWNVVKAPKLNVNPPKMTVDFILSLLYRGYEEIKPQRDLRDRIVADSNVRLSRQAKHLGYEIASRLDKTKESQIESWCEHLWNAFEEFGFERPESLVDKDRLNLPSIYQLMDYLGGAAGFIEDIAAIKAIGSYLSDLNLPDESDRWRGCRRDYREKALKLVALAKNKKSIEDKEG